MPKFVEWIPTPTENVSDFFKLLSLSSSDLVYDLGSGDGRLLFAAIERGAGKCLGIDIDYDMVCVARKAAIDKGLEGKVIFIEADITSVDLSPATVILCYLWPSAVSALRMKFETELRPGTRIIMETFPVRQWKPAKIVQTTGRNFYLYIMPPQKDEDYVGDIYYEAYEQCY